MKTVKYKTLRGLLRQMSGNQFTLNNFFEERFHHKTKGWVRFYFDNDDAEWDACRLFAEAIWSRVDNGRVAQIRDYWGDIHGIFRRVWIDRRSGESTYCAGQDYVSEIRTIQRLLA